MRVCAVGSSSFSDRATTTPCDNEWGLSVSVACLRLFGRDGFALRSPKIASCGKLQLPPSPISGSLSPSSRCLCHSLAPEMPDSQGADYDYRTSSVDEDRRRAKEVEKRVNDRHAAAGAGPNGTSGGGADGQRAGAGSQVNQENAEAVRVIQTSYRCVVVRRQVQVGDGDERVSVVLCACGEGLHE